MASDASNGDAPEEVKTVTIRIFGSHDEAHLAAANLEAHGIRCWINSDDAGGMYPNLALAGGGVRLLVRASEAEAAMTLLESRASPAEISELEAKAVAAAPENPPKVKLAPIQFFLGLGLGIFLCLLCQQMEKSGARTNYVYAKNGQCLEEWMYQNNRLVEMVKDRNLDGKWDEWVFYNRGWLVRSELDNNFDGKPDEWWTYSNGNPASFEKDTDFNGIPDEFCTYTNGVLQQMEVRPNGSSFATQRWIYHNGVLSEIWRDGDSDGIFNEIVKYNPFFNATNTQFGRFPTK
jgi:Putative prokaryotic signal transducing protein